MCKAIKPIGMGIDKHPNTGTAPSPAARPDGIRLELTLRTSALTGALTRDWVRPELGATP